MLQNKLVIAKADLSEIKSIQLSIFITHFLWLSLSPAVAVQEKRVHPEQVTCLSLGQNEVIYIILFNVKVTEQGVNP